MADEQLDALVAKRYPAEWARALKQKSGFRTKLRKRFKDEQEIEALRSVGCRCANCASFEPMPLMSGHPGEMMCAAHSDFHGYSITTAEKLCKHWTEKKTP